MPPGTQVPTDTRRSRYFRAYYEAHRDAILAKNRRWGAEHKARLAELRRARRERHAPEPHACADCEAIVLRAPRCPKCRVRFRYQTDPEYRARRLATTRRWQHKQTRG